MIPNKTVAENDVLYDLWEKARKKAIDDTAQASTSWPASTYPQDNLMSQNPTQDDVNRQRDEVVKRMLNTPPTPHKSRKKREKPTSS